MSSLSSSTRAVPAEKLGQKLRLVMSHDICFGSEEIPGLMDVFEPSMTNLGGTLSALCIDRWMAW